MQDSQQDITPQKIKRVNKPHLVKLMQPQANFDNDQGRIVDRNLKEQSFGISLPETQNANSNGNPAQDNSSFIVLAIQDSSNLASHNLPSTSNFDNLKDTNGYGYPTQINCDIYQQGDNIKPQNNSQVIQKSASKNQTRIGPIISHNIIDKSLSSIRKSENVETQQDESTSFLNFVTPKTQKTPQGSRFNFRPPSQPKFKQDQKDTSPIQLTLKGNNLNCNKQVTGQELEHGNIEEQGGDIQNLENPFNDVQINQVSNGEPDNLDQEIIKSLRSQLMDHSDLFVQQVILDSAEIELTNNVNQSTSQNNLETPNNQQVPADASNQLILPQQKIVKFNEAEQFQARRRSIGDEVRMQSKKIQLKPSIAQLGLVDGTFTGIKSVPIFESLSSRYHAADLNAKKSRQTCALQVRKNSGEKERRDSNLSCNVQHDDSGQRISAQSFKFKILDKNTQVPPQHKTLQKTLLSLLPQQDTVKNGGDRQFQIIDQNDKNMPLNRKNKSFLLLQKHRNAAATGKASGNSYLNRNSVEIQPKNSNNLKRNLQRPQSSLINFQEHKKVNNDDKSQKSAQFEQASKIMKEDAQLIQKAQISFREEKRLNLSVAFQANEQINGSTTQMGKSSSNAADLQTLEVNQTSVEENRQSCSGQGQSQAPNNNSSLQITNAIDLNPTVKFQISRQKVTSTLQTKKRAQSSSSRDLTGKNHLNDKQPILSVKQVVASQVQSQRQSKNVSRQSSRIKLQPHPTNPHSSERQEVQVQSTVAVPMFAVRSLDNVLSRFQYGQQANRPQTSQQACTPKVDSHSLSHRNLNDVQQTSRSLNDPNSYNLLAAQKQSRKSLRQNQKPCQQLPLQDRQAPISQQWALKQVDIDNLQALEKSLNTCLRESGHETHLISKSRLDNFQEDTEEQRGSISTSNGLKSQRKVKSVNQRFRKKQYFNVNTPNNYNDQHESALPSHQGTVIGFYEGPKGLGRKTSQDRQMIKNLIDGKLAKTPNAPENFTSKRKSHTPLLQDKTISPSGLSIATNRQEEEQDDDLSEKHQFKSVERNDEIQSKSRNGSKSARYDSRKQSASVQDHMKLHKVNEKPQEALDHLQCLGEPKIINHGKQVQGKLTKHSVKSVNSSSKQMHSNGFRRQAFTQNSFYDRNQRALNQRQNDRNTKLDSQNADISEAMEQNGPCDDKSHKSLKQTKTELSATELDRTKKSADLVSSNLSPSLVNNDSPIRKNNQGSINKNDQNSLNKSGKELVVPSEDQFKPSSPNRIQIQSRARQSTTQEDEEVFDSNIPTLNCETIQSATKKINGDKGASLRTSGGLIQLKRFRQEIQLSPLSKIDLISDPNPRKRRLNSRNSKSPPPEQRQSASPQEQLLTQPSCSMQFQNIQMPRTTKNLPSKVIKFNRPKTTSSFVPAEESLQSPTEKGKNFKLHLMQISNKKITDEQNLMRKSVASPSDSKKYSQTTAFGNDAQIQIANSTPKLTLVQGRSPILLMQSPMSNAQKRSQPFLKDNQNPSLFDLQKIKMSEGLRLVQGGGSITEDENKTLNSSLESFSNADHIAMMRKKDLDDKNQNGQDSILHNVVSSNHNLRQKRKARPSTSFLKQKDGQRIETFAKDANGNQSQQQQNLRMGRNMKVQDLVQFLKMHQFGHFDENFGQNKISLQGQQLTSSDQVFPQTYLNDYQRKVEMQKKLQKLLTIETKNQQLNEFRQIKQKLIPVPQLQDQNRIQTPLSPSSSISITDPSTLKQTNLTNFKGQRLNYQGQQHQKLTSPRTNTNSSYKGLLKGSVCNVKPKKAQNKWRQFLVQKNQITRAVINQEAVRNFHGNLETRKLPKSQQSQKALIFQAKVDSVNQRLSREILSKNEKFFIQKRPKTRQDMLPLQQIDFQLIEKSDIEKETEGLFSNGTFSKSNIDQNRIVAATNVSVTPRALQTKSDMLYIRNSGTQTLSASPSNQVNSPKMIPDSAFISLNNRFAMNFLEKACLQQSKSGIELLKQAQEKQIATNLGGYNLINSTQFKPNNNNLKIKGMVSQNNFSELQQQKGQQNHQSVSTLKQDYQGRNSSVLATEIDENVHITGKNSSILSESVQRESQKNNYDIQFGRNLKEFGYKKSLPSSSQRQFVGLSSQRDSLGRDILKGKGDQEIQNYQQYIGIPNQQIRSAQNLSLESQSSLEEEEGYENENLARQAFLQPTIIKTKKRLVQSNKQGLSPKRSRSKKRHHQQDFLKVQMIQQRRKVGVDKMTKEGQMISTSNGGSRQTLHMKLPEAAYMIHSSQSKQNMMMVNQDRLNQPFDQQIKGQQAISGDYNLMSKNPQSHNADPLLGNSSRKLLDQEQIYVNSAQWSPKRIAQKSRDKLTNIGSGFRPKRYAKSKRKI